MSKTKPQLKVMAGYSRRFDASYRDAKEKVDKGLIGTPYLVRSQTCDLLDATGFFVRYAAKNGGIFVDCAIHDIDLTMFFMGDIKPKACWVRPIPPPALLPQHADKTCKGHRHNRAPPRTQSAR